MSANIQIPLAQYATLTLAGSSDVPSLPSGTPTSLQPGSCGVKIADYASFYVADLGNDPSGVGRRIAVVPKSQPGVGGVLSSSIHCTGNDGASGSPLTPADFTVEVDGAAPPPPQAATFGIFNLTFGTLASAPADPGSDTISF